MLLPLLWLLKKKKLFFLLIFVLLLGWKHYRSYISIHPFASHSEEKKSFRLMTYNVRVFNLYDWKKNVQWRKDIIHLIDSVNPDILCLQEYVYDDRKKFDTRDTIMEIGNYKYYKEYFSRQNRYFHFGMAVFSRYPIISGDLIKFPNSLNSASHSKVIINKDTVCLWNLHLQSIHIDKKEYYYLDSLSANIEEKHLNTTKEILRKYKKAALLREQQTLYVEDLIDNCKYPVIVCGDFNSAPSSYVYSKFINSGLSDAFVEAGNGVGATYYRFKLPFRIDYVFYPKNLFNIFRCNVIKKNLSDHYPVVVDFEDK